MSRTEPNLGQLIAGVIPRQARCIRLDPYATAFNDGPKGSCRGKDLTEMKKELHELLPKIHAERTHLLGEPV